MPPLVSVIVPVYRDWERLALCLDALSRQTLDHERFEIIVANNEAEASHGAEDLPRNARLVHEPTPGSYAARNTAVKAARGAILAFTDSDCVPSPQWLERALTILKAHPGARVTGPVTIFREAGASAIAFTHDFHTAFKQKEAVGLGRCATANLIVERSVLDFVGPFNEALVSGGDTEWGDRAHKAGVPIVYDEQVAVGHPARRSVAEIVSKRRRLAGSIALRKGYPTWRYFLYRLLPPFRHFWRSVIGFKRGPLRPLDWVLLFFVHWRGQFAEGLEFLMVRKGWKAPNRS
jgi:glycosyltransferase involved in cell wall biosynthesis